MSNMISGIILFRLRGELIYLSREAHRLLSLHFPSQPEPQSGVLIPPQLSSLCHELMVALTRSGGGMDWQAVRVQQMVSSPQGGVLLRGFGVPDELPHECGRLLLLIEPIIEQGEADSFSSREQIRLTHREGAVARYLAAGLTNKEIANHLHLSEYTVKDHVKRLMRKTQTTTRTATVSRLLLQYPSLSKAKVTDGIMGTIFAKQAV